VTHGRRLPKEREGGREGETAVKCGLAVSLKMSRFLEQRVLGLWCDVRDDRRGIEIERERDRGGERKREEDRALSL
jgi:hypothetical protein